MASPRYRDITASDIPNVREAGCTVGVVSGSYGGVQGATQGDHVKALLLDVALAPDAAWRMPVDPESTLCLYVVEGSGMSGDPPMRIDSRRAVLYGDGEEVAVLAGHEGLRDVHPPERRRCPGPRGPQRLRGPEMLQFTIDQAKCTKCGLCVLDCPSQIIEAPVGGVPLIRPENEERCIRCQHCLAVCPPGALGNTPSGVNRRALTFAVIDDKEAMGRFRGKALGALAEATALLLRDAVRPPGRALRADRAARPRARSSRRVVGAGEVIPDLDRKVGRIPS